MKKGFTFLIAAILLMATHIGWAQVTDELTYTLIGVTGTNYSDWSDVTSNSSAVYAGNTAGGNTAIQLRSKNSNSGIVTTTSGGTVTHIAVTWNSNTGAGRKLNVYGSNNAYTAASELYGDNAGTLIGTIDFDSSTDLEITDSYEYIGLRSASGALWLDNITITWSSGGTPNPPSRHPARKSNTTPPRAASPTSSTIPSLAER